MPHKITLTGSATGPLREYDRYVAFDMREKGSPSAPKGLKKSTFISYTVFVAKKAFNKTGLTKKSIMHEKILIQGEPTLDIPIDECPGEVGVICFQITVLPNKNDKEKNQSEEKKNLNKRFLRLLRPRRTRNLKNRKKSKHLFLNL
ncbi:hypothetical protein AAAC51_44875 [Priestia megaterium]